MGRHAANAPQADQAAGLEKWPACPRDFTAEEKQAWARLGRALLPARLVTEADLLLSEETARVMARVRRLYVDTELKASTLKGWLDLLTKMLGELGLSPKARKNVAVPKAPKRKTEAASVLEED